MNHEGHGEGGLFSRLPTPDSGLPTPDSGLNVAAVVKGDERYVFLWVDAYWPDVLDTIRRFIEDPQLSFTQYDRDRFLKKLGEQGYFEKLAAEGWMDDE